jgi:N-acyl-D-aspartate/D-glutamate deacylase
MSPYLAPGRRVLLWVTVSSALAVIGATQPAPFDLVIANARVVDGTGAPAVAGDVGIRGGRIAAVGRLGSAAATERLDAHGLVVAPGFVDVHTHADDLASHPLAENFARMGVTTIVAGNCGSSALSIGDALARIRERGVAVNYATLIGHNTVRAEVMGDVERPPTVAELDRMRSLVYRAMVEGAVGFSTGLQYVPGIYAHTNEIVELARVAANEGGIYATHMRNEGTAVEEAVTESIRVAEMLDMPLEISHLKIDSPVRWGSSGAVLAVLDDARRRGVDVEADQYAYTAGSSTLAIRFPAWALEGGPADVRARLDDAATWVRVKKDMQALLEERGFHDLSWATVASYPGGHALDGLSMKDVAMRLEGRDTPDAQLEAARTLMLGGGATMVYHFMSEDDVERIMRDPMVSVASDAGVIEPGVGAPHPRGNGNNARVLGEYVRERRLISIEEAVRKMTSLPARHFGFKDRGVIRVGAVADLVVFDPARVRDAATYAAPHQAPEGIPHVLVGGVFIVRDGKITGATPGQVLRGGGKDIGSHFSLTTTEKMTPDVFSLVAAIWPSR